MYVKYVSYEIYEVIVCVCVCVILVEFGGVSYWCFARIVAQDPVNGPRWRITVIALCDGMI